MILSKRLDKHNVNEKVFYEYLQNEVVGMGPKRVHSYSIVKVYVRTDDDKSYHWIANGIKSKDASELIWADVVAGIQK